jgi:hypothetical protein
LIGAASANATQVRIGNIATQNASLGCRFWRHTDLAVSYCCMPVGRFKEILTLE